MWPSQTRSTTYEDRTDSYVEDVLETEASVANTFVVNVVLEKPLL